MGPELRKLIIGVITSWQVIAVTLVIVGFYILVIGAAHIGEGGRKRFSIKKKGGKKSKTPVPVPKPTKDDDLGIEEE